MKQIAEMEVGELAAYICGQLQQRGIRVVLTGGSCVTIYSDNRYASYDLDFIESGNVPRRKIRLALEELGFSEENRYFRHPDTLYFVEFPSGPLAIGQQPVTETAELTYSTGLLRLLTPTDCVMDRLAAYFHWNDRQCRQQAIWIARLHPIDWEKIAQWSLQEGEATKFEQFRQEVAET